jgi:hypothetical protein
VQIARRAVFVAVAILVGAYYLWSARATGQKFLWGYDLGGYYNYLARGFARGHLYVDIQPSPQLLALPDPYAASVDESLKVHDMALYRGHYYLYHGAAPAVLLFTPWRLITGHDVPENFALALFCFAGFLFSAGTLLRVLWLTKAEVSPILLAVLLLALGVCQGVPYLLSRIWVYEIAIGGGYCCLSAAVFFLARSIRSARSPAWLAASGLMFGLSIACRPHLGLAAVAATAALAVASFRKRRPGAIVPFIVPLAAVGLAIATYNYLRFGNFFEFGVHYLLGNPTLNRTELAGRYVLPGLYYMLFCAPDFSPVFPWIRLAFRYPFHAAGYFLEPTAGSLFLAPFLIGILLVPRARGARTFLAIVATSAAAIMLFITGTGFTSQRYEVDFLPLAALAGAAGFAVAIARGAGWQRRLRTAALVLLVTAGVASNLALGISGPYDELLKNRPASYARIARWFSPIERFRPLLNPSVDVEFTARFTPQPDGFREPLLAMGRQTFRDVLVAEHHPGKFRLISQSETSSAAQEIVNPGAQMLRFHVTYRPESRKLAVAVNDVNALTHNLESLFTAPAQVRVGENRIAPDISSPRFTGRIDPVRAVIGSVYNSGVLAK